MEMLNYRIENNKIIVDKKDFCPQHILECGQVFSYKKEDNNYVVYSADKMAILTDLGDFVEIETLDIDYFINYFDLKTDYSIIKKHLMEKFPFLKNSIDFGYGIRILKQDPFETIISFVVSANNNIKRIQNILFTIRERFGSYKNGYYSFPTLNQLSKATIEDFLSIGAGYRAKYLFEVCKQLKNINLNELSKLPTDKLNEVLLSLMGVGQKVSDCIMLFAFSKCDVFPVDTWIEKVFNQYFYEEHNRKIIRQYLLNQFKNFSGYAQQYLFYSQREGI